MNSSTTSELSTEPALGKHARAGVPSTTSGGTNWVAVWAVAAGAFALVMSEFLAIGLLPDVAKSLDVSEGTAGLMVTAPGLMAALSAPLLTMAAARVDRRVILLSLSVLLVASNLLAALAPAFSVLMVARLLLGVAVGGFWTIGVSVAPRLVPAQVVPRAASVITSGITLATVASLPLGSLAGDLLGWRAGFLIITGLALATLVLQFFALPRMPAQHAVTFGSLLTLFKMPRARAGVIASVLVFFGHFAGYTYLSPALHNLAHIDSTWTTPVLLLFGVTGIVGNFAAGVTAARSIRGTLTAGVILLVSSLALLPLIGTTAPGAVVLVGLWGLAWGAMPLGLQLWILDAMGEKADSGLALFISASQLALAAGAFLGGVTVDSAGVSPDLLIAAAVSAAALIALWTAPRLSAAHSNC